MKKRKLNSTNPKYRKEKTKEKLTKKLINEKKNFKVYAVFKGKNS